VRFDRKIFGRSRQFPPPPPPPRELSWCLQGRHSISRRLTGKVAAKIADKKKMKYLGAAYAPRGIERQNRDRRSLRNLVILIYEIGRAISIPLHHAFGYR